MKYLLLLAAFTLVLFSKHTFAQNQTMGVITEKTELPSPKLSMNTGTNSMMQQQHYRNPWRIHRQVGQYGLIGMYTATVIGAAAMEDAYAGTTVIPVIGPFITILRIEDDPDAFYQPGGKQLLTVSGITQSAFLLYFVTSLIGERSYRNKQRQKQFSVAPMLSGTGISMNVRF